jgi:retron-type reverse transcriptase
MHLLRLWIRAGRRYKHPDRGIAQGMPVAPLLCNVYLHRLDQPLVLGRWKVVRYADDFIVCCRTEAEAQRAYERVAHILEGLKLRYEPRKTRLASFRQEFDFLGVRFSATSYSFLWEDKRFEITGPTPRWLWGYAPQGYGD